MFLNVFIISDERIAFSFCRGVGCIFTEMVSGVATFPGMKDTYDQLDKIFWVSECIIFLYIRTVSNPIKDITPGRPRNLSEQITNYKCRKIVSLCWFLCIFRNNNTCKFTW